MSLDEIEDFQTRIKICPKCRSSEGFWLTAKRDMSYVQCKHCGAIIELCELSSIEKDAKKNIQNKRSILRRELKL